MNWFVAALIAQALYALSNHIDKLLLSRYLEVHSVSVLIIISSLVGAVFLPFVSIYHPSVINIAPVHAAIIIAAGVVGVAALYPYFIALHSEDPTFAIPIFQTIPVFTYLLGVVLLGEHLSSRELLGGAIIVLGSMAISFDLTLRHPRLKVRLLFLMLLSSFLLSTSNILFKLVAVETSYLTAIFWEYVGGLMCGIYLLLRKRSRDEVEQLVRRAPLMILGLNGLNEALAVIGTFFIRFAQVLVPVALAQSVLGFQPVTVFLMSVVLTLYFPHILKEDFQFKVLVQKLLCTIVIVIGSLLIT